VKALLLASALFLGLCLLVERFVHAHASTLEPRIEKLVTLPPGASVAAISLAGSAPGSELLYVRAKGLWRSREASGAVCDDKQVEALIAACTQARGEEFTRDPAREARYGLAPSERLTISFHGAKLLERDDRDRLAGLELGRLCARRVGEPAIFSIDRDPRAALTPSAPGLPPLVDTRLLAGCFGPGFAGFRRIALDYKDGRSFALETQPAVGDAPPEWTLVVGGEHQSAITWRPGGYTSLWIRARAKSFENPKQAAALGLEQPFLRITLLPTVGEAIELCLSERSPANEALLWNRRTNVLMRIEGELVPDLAPEASAFTDSARVNPWERWLMR